jgi:hypothetical protein
MRAPAAAQPTSASSPYSDAHWRRRERNFKLETTLPRAPKNYEGRRQAHSKPMPIMYNVYHSLCARRNVMSLALSIFGLKLILLVMLRTGFFVQNYCL